MRLGGASCVGAVAGPPASAAAATAPADGGAPAAGPGGPAAITDWTSWCEIRGTVCAVPETSAGSGRRPSEAGSGTSILVVSANAAGVTTIGGADARSVTTTGLETT